ncbi:MAG: SDR family NAD(P)-dependent oxidoreductase, partial [Geminicoccales bacterium]
MASKELAGRIALVTGGSRGIGRAVCVRLARDGARVAINYASDEVAARETRALVEAADAECLLIKADVSDPEAVAAMIAEVERGLGPVDLL